jgi:plasmid replication initiation protein
MSDLTIYKDNNFINASYKLSLNEQRIILCCIGKIRSDQELAVGTIFRLSVSEYAERFGITEKRAYCELRADSKRLWDRHITLSYDSLPDAYKSSVTNVNGIFKIRWIEVLGYDEKQQEIYIGFTNALLPYISQLKKEFTKYNLANISNMSSIYAIRLYELLAQNQFKLEKELIIPIVDLKEKFQIEKKYDSFGNLNSRVIQPALEQINEFSNFSVTCDFKKEGKKVVDLVFKFTVKEGLEATRNPSKNPNKRATDKEIKENSRPGETESEARSRIINNKQNARSTTRAKDFTVNGITFQDEQSMNEYIEGSNISRNKENGLTHISKIRASILSKN